jgi:glutamate synthase (NADPH) large chain
MALASNYPQAQGLYDPAAEHDACGVAMVATLNKVCNT